MALSVSTVKYEEELEIQLFLSAKNEGICVKIVAVTIKEKSCQTCLKN